MNDETDIYLLGYSNSINMEQSNTFPYNVGFIATFTNDKSCFNYTRDYQTVTLDYTQPAKTLLSVSIN